MSAANILDLVMTPSILLVGISTMISFTWPIGITTTIDAVVRAPPYRFGNLADASIRFAGVVGALLGFGVGYIFGEWIYSGSDGKRQATWRSEYRLHGVWLPTGSMVAGLLTYGLTIHCRKSWVGLAFGWIMVNVGVVGSTVATSSFTLEKYHNQSAVVSAILNMWRTSGGFAVAYFQPSWIARDGAAVVFATQAAVVLVSVILLNGSAIWLGTRATGRRTASSVATQQHQPLELRTGSQGVPYLRAAP